VTTSTASDQNLLEKIGVALIGVRLSSYGMDEGEARQSGDGIGAVTGLNLRVNSEENIHPVLTFEQGEFESNHTMLTRGDDPELIQLTEDDDLNDEDWENTEGEEGFLYLSQVLASMVYGNAPYSEGDHDLIALLSELGITDSDSEKLILHKIVNLDTDKKLTAMFNEEAAKRGLDPQDHFGVSYTID
jgi:hypothetical protein